MNILDMRAAPEKEPGKPAPCFDTKRKQEGAGDRNRGQHRDQDAEPEDKRKAFDERGAKPEENDGGYHRRDIGIADRRPCSSKSFGNRFFCILTATQEFAFRLGMAMVGALMIFSTYNDLSRLLQRLTGGSS